MLTECVGKRGDMMRSVVMLAGLDDCTRLGVSIEVLSVGGRDETVRGEAVSVRDEAAMGNVGYQYCRITKTRDDSIKTSDCGWQWRSGGVAE